jgi:hypothetical protein
MDTELELGVRFQFAQVGLPCRSAASFVDHFMPSARPNAVDCDGSRCLNPISQASYGEVCPQLSPLNVQQDPGSLAGTGIPL